MCLSKEKAMAAQLSSKNSAIVDCSQVMSPVAIWTLDWAVIVGVLSVSMAVVLVSDVT
jgi:hypothetical protein